MKRNESKKKITIISQKTSTNKTDKKSVLKKFEIEKTLSYPEKINFEKNNYFKKKMDFNSNSQLLLYKNRDGKPIKLPNNIHIYKSKDKDKLNIVKGSDHSLNNSLGLNKSQSKNNLKTVFPIIDKKKNIPNSNINNYANDKNKNIKSKKFKFPISERNFFNNYLNNRNNIKIVKH